MTYHGTDYYDGDASATICLSCDTPITEDQERRPMGYLHLGPGGNPIAEQRFVHNECGLREVIGGIGHLTDHNYWCLTMGDPDGGMSYRESALAVLEWVKEHGVEAAAAIQP